MDKKYLIVEQAHGCEGDCLVMDENRVAGPKPWGGGRVVKKWLLDRRQVQEIVKICNRFLGEAPDDRWIPVSERLPSFFPERRRAVLVTLVDDYGKTFVTTAKYHEEYKYWYDFSDCRFNEFKVIAWMLKPDAYEP